MYCSEDVECARRNECEHEEMKRREELKYSPTYDNAGPFTIIWGIVVTVSIVIIAIGMIYDFLK